MRGCRTQTIDAFLDGEGHTMERSRCTSRPVCPVGQVSGGKGCIGKYNGNRVGAAIHSLDARQVSFHHFPTRNCAGPNHGGQLGRCKLVKLRHDGVFTAFGSNLQLD
jgi:hypothetical protein